MAITAGSRSGEPMMEINTTPLIDVMLVLLIMFIITLPVMTHSVKLDLPATPNPPADRLSPINLEIDFDGAIIWNGAVVPLAMLDGYFRTEALKQPQAELHLRPHRRADYDTVAKVLAMAQRQGLKHIGFVGTEEFLR